MGLMPPARARRPALVLVTANDVEDSFHGAWLKLIYADACARLGLDLSMQSYPARRSTAMSDAGLVDGEINRVRTYGAMHPAMLRIDPAHFAVNFCAYGHPPVRLGKGWSGLVEFGNPRIDYRNGVARCLEKLGALPPTAHVSAVNNATVGIRKLAQRRTDLYVDIESVVERVLLQPEFANARIRRLAVVETIDMHCYLHRSRRELLQPLSAALAAMHKNGSVERHRKAAMAGAGPLSRPASPA
jgi:polar amino acid transport system substrate-binding protein